MLLKTFKGLAIQADKVYYHVDLLCAFCTLRNVATNFNFMLPHVNKLLPHSAAVLARDKWRRLCSLDFKADLCSFPLGYNTHSWLLLRPLRSLANSHEPLLCRTHSKDHRSRMGSMGGLRNECQHTRHCWQCPRRSPSCLTPLLRPYPLDATHGNTWTITTTMNKENK